MKQALSLAVATLSLLMGWNPAQAQSAPREAGYLYLSPMPRSPWTSPQTRFVLVRFVDVIPSEVTNLTTSFITVTGMISGLHTGVTHVASDRRTVIFEMAVDFSQTELVTVTLNPQLDPAAGGTVEPFEYQFMVNAPMPDSPLTPLLSPGEPVLRGNLPDKADQEPSPVEGDTITGAAVIMPNGVSVPGDFPKIVITVNSNPAPGYLFLENGRSLSTQYSMMVDNNGSPVWYRRGWLWDFKVQDNGLITWGTPTNSGQQYFGFDQNFNFVQTYNTVNGYATDQHELKILKDGTYFLIGSQTNTVDLSKYYPGGVVSSVIETVFQEFTAANELIFQWRAWDHYKISDQIGNLEFPHMNAVTTDEDGQILVSCRHTDEVTKINRDTGDIIWRLGGVNNGFTFLNDPLNGFTYQHAIVALGNDRYLLFDDGDLHTPPVSRAVEYQLDLTNMTATMVWQFRDAPDKYTYWMGNAQRLPNGNTLIDFVRSIYPKAIEVDPNGVKRFELTLVPNADSYRVFRFPWQGVAAAPYLLVEPESDNVTLVFNKFGDHAVDHYRIYGGTSPEPTNFLATSSTTLKHLTNVVNGVRNYFRVTAVSTNGLESDYSNEENLLVNITLPGRNMVLNGDFSQSTNAWSWVVTPPASAQWSISEGISHVEITDGGIYISDIQLEQTGLQLTQGRHYIFEFDAWSSVPRTLEAGVEQNADGGINYSGTEPFSITPLTNHYLFTFTMEDPTDHDARVVFSAGAFPDDVYIANVSLREQLYAPGDFNQDGCVGFDDLKAFTEEWGKKQGALISDLNRDGKVNFADFVIFSKGWSGGGFCP